MCSSSLRAWHIEFHATATKRKYDLGAVRAAGDTSVSLYFGNVSNTTRAHYESHDEPGVECLRRSTSFPHAAQSRSTKRWNGRGPAGSGFPRGVART